MVVRYRSPLHHFESVLGVRFGASARQIFPRWQEFMAGGPGQLTAGSSMQMLVDMGDDFVTYSDPLLPFYPRFEITDTDDDGKVILFKALDTTGRPVFDSVGNAWLSITLSVAGAFYSGVIGKITEIHKPLTQGAVNLLAVSVADTTLKAQIGSYEPTETVPSYKRYKAVAGQFSSTVTCLCKRRFVSLVNVADDETLITPSNEGALKLTLMALQYEDKNDLERAETYFQKAIYLLNAELKEDMGDPVITLQMNPLAAAMNIPNRY